MSQGKAAEQLRLDATVVEAIETDSYATLGAPVYARGHLRKYAVLLGVPGDELLAAYDRLQSGPVAPSLIPAASAREFSRPRPWLLPLAAVLLAMLLAGSLVWVFGRSTPAATTATTAAPDAAPPAGIGADGPTGALPGDDALPPANPHAAPPGPTAAPADTGAAVAAPPVTAGARAPAAPAVKAGDAALTIAVSAPCWLEVYDAAGRRVAFEMAPANAVRRYGGGPWKVLLGNAAAARLTLNGRELPVPGDYIARNVAWVEVTRGGGLRRTDAAQPVPPER